MEIKPETQISEFQKEFLKCAEVREKLENVTEQEECLKNKTGFVSGSQTFFVATSLEKFAGLATV